MNATSNRSKTRPDSTAFRLRILGVGVLLLGLATAAGIWLARDMDERRNPPSDPGLAEPTFPLDSRKGSREIEMYYGKSGVVAEKWSEWVAGLTHGKRLAWAVAAFSCAASAGFFLMAGFLLPILRTPVRQFDLSKLDPPANPGNTGI